MSASQTIYFTNNDDASTEAEVPIEFKHPPALDVNVDIQVEELQIENNEDNEEGDGKEKREQQMIVPFCDNDHYQADVEKELSQQQIQRHINNITFTNNNLNTVANIIEIGTVATKCEQQTQEQQQNLLVQQGLQNNKSQTDEKPCTLIYKRPDDYMADDSDDYVIRLQQQRRLQEPQQYQQPQQLQQYQQSQQYEQPQQYQQLQQYQQAQQYEQPQQYQQPQQYEQLQQYQQHHQLQQHQQQKQYIIVDSEYENPVKRNITCTSIKENTIDSKSNNKPLESGANQQKNCSLDETRYEGRKWWEGNCFCFKLRKLDIKGLLLSSFYL